MSVGTKTTSVLKYSLLPGLFPRFRELFGSGFSYFAFLMAQIYAMPGLLPDTHPYLNSANIGRFGIRHVIAAAASNLEFKRDKSDQIIFFFVLLIGLVLMVFQLLGMVIALMAPDAFAGPMGAYFGVNPASDSAQDIAFIMLDRVFGVPNIFNSCVTTAESCYRLDADFNYDLANPMSTPQAPWPFHLALHQLFRFYNMGLLVIGMFIILYYAIVIAVETAQTGTPFGKRFNTVWAPIRLVVAIGLLVPLSSGLSSSQYLILYAAKLGSNMATNGWIVFNQSVVRAEAGMLAGSNAIGTPNAPSSSEVISFLALAKACQITEDSHFQTKESHANRTTHLLNNDDGVKPACETKSLDNQNIKRTIKPYIVAPALKTPNFKPYESTSYTDALEFSNHGDIAVSFGQRNECLFGSLPGNVSRDCGKLVFPVKALTEPGAQVVQAGYFDLVKKIWADPELERIAEFYVGAYFGNNTGSGSGLTSSQFHTLVAKYNGDRSNPNPAPDTTAHIIKEGRIAAANPANWDIPAQLLKRGWGSAGIWYNRIAQINGAFVGASRNLPTPAFKPAIMERVGIHNRQTHQSIDLSALYDPSTVNANQKGGFKFGRNGENIEAARVYHQLNNYLVGVKNVTVQTESGNPIISVINALLGTEGLFNMTKPENRDVHPLSLLAGLGKGLVESSVFMLGTGTIAGAACATGQGVGCQVMGLGYGIAGLGLTVGFVLFYVIPFLPFVYFFFAVGGWVKGIFEAMVGAPLWALGHLRIDGNGLPGEGAINGYYLIFEVFIRPILIVFGFLGGILIFGAMAAVLNDIWTSVVENVSGGDPLSFEDAGELSDYLEVARGAVDKMFFTILYAIIMYMMALSSFKLIDLIPNGILRWMGSSASSFGDTNQDVAGNLTQYAAIGGGMVFQQGLGGIQGGFQGANQSVNARKGLAQQQETNARMEAGQRDPGPPK